MKICSQKDQKVVLKKVANDDPDVLKVLIDHANGRVFKPLDNDKDVLQLIISADGVVFNVPEDQPDELIVHERIMLDGVALKEINEIPDQLHIIYGEGNVWKNIKDANDNLSIPPSALLNKRIDKPDKLIVPAIVKQTVLKEINDTPDQLLYVFGEGKNFPNINDENDKLSLLVGNGIVLNNDINDKSDKLVLPGNTFDLKFQIKDEPDSAKELEKEIEFFKFKQNLLKKKRTINKTFRKRSKCKKKLKQRLRMKKKNEKKKTIKKSNLYNILKRLKDSINKKIR